MSDKKNDNPQPSRDVHSIQELEEISATLIAGLAIKQKEMDSDPQQLKQQEDSLNYLKQYRLQVEAESEKSITLASSEDLPVMSSDVENQPEELISAPPVIERKKPQSLNKGSVIYTNRTQRGTALPQASENSPPIPPERTSPVTHGLAPVINMPPATNLNTDGEDPKFSNSKSSAINTTTQLRLERKREKQKQYEKRKKEQRKTQQVRMWNQFLQRSEVSISAKKTDVQLETAETKKQIQTPVLTNNSVQNSSVTTPELTNIVVEVPGSEIKLQSIVSIERSVQENSVIVPEVADTALETTESEIKLQPLVATKSPVQDSFVTAQSTPYLVSSASPAIVSPTSQPIAELKASDKAPAEKKMDMDPIFFLELPSLIIKPCLEELKANRAEALLLNEKTEKYREKIFIANVELRTLSQIILALNRPEFNGYLEDWFRLRILMLALIGEYHAWCYINNGCEQSILNMRKAAVIKATPDLNEDPIDFLTKQLRGSAPKNLVEIIPGVKTPWEEAFEAELIFYRDKGKEKLERNIIELGQVGRRVLEQKKHLTGFISIFTVDPKENPMKEDLDQLHQRMSDEIEKVKTSRTDIGENIQWLAEIAYQLRINLVKLEKQHNNLQQARMELISNFLNLKDNVKVKKYFLKTKKNVQQCELSCVGIYTKNQPRLDSLSLTRFGLEELVVKIQPLLLRRAKLAPSSELWVTQVVQNAISQALDDAFITDKFSLAIAKIKSATTSLEQAAKNLKRSETAVQINIRSCLEGLKRLSQVYQLMDELRNIQGKISHIQLPTGALIEKDQRPLKRNLRKIALDLENKLQGLSEIDAYIKHYLVSKTIKEPLLSLAEILIELRAIVSKTITRQQENVGNKQRSLEPVSTVPEQKNKDVVEVKNTLKTENPPKLLAETSRFVGKTPSVKLLEPENNEIAVVADPLANTQVETTTISTSSSSTQNEALTTFHS
ncbi:MAG TPA: hypothetical protein VHE99_03480 [Gammaproteobacteria bacterium]|nr:hypothetical protein [Gammaproteobacteria bacterium]